jgi:hypothetical protein
VKEDALNSVIFSLYSHNLAEKTLQTEAYQSFDMHRRVAAAPKLADAKSDLKAFTEEWKPYIDDKPNRSILKDIQFNVKAAGHAAAYFWERWTMPQEVLIAPMTNGYYKDYQGHIDEAHETTNSY